jgi:hypothetical protein
MEPDFSVPWFFLFGHKIRATAFAVAPFCCLPARQGRGLVEVSFGVVAVHGSSLGKITHIAISLLDAVAADIV